MYRKLQNEDLAIGSMAKDMKGYSLNQIANLADRIAKIYGEPIREKLMAKLFSNLAYTA
mgnify:CR=1 FL=1